MSSWEAELPTSSFRTGNLPVVEDINLKDISSRQHVLVMLIAINDTIASGSALISTHEGFEWVALAVAMDRGRKGGH